VDELAHWQKVYKERAADEVSWFERSPRASLELIEQAAIPRDSPLVDVGGGESRLAAELLGRGFSNITVADISPTALAVARAELGDEAEKVSWVVADIRDHDFGGQFALWHDRALFHFMVEQTDRDAYLATLEKSVAREGQLIIATFGPDGPTSCSGLPVERYGAGQLGALLPDFELASSRTVLHRTPGGKEQQFLYARFARC
jgi:ubiquinone/menaquinone biosynthesis C-methylase UbiE